MCAAACCQWSAKAPFAFPYTSTSKWLGLLAPDGSGEMLVLYRRGLTSSDSPQVRRGDVSWGGPLRARFITNGRLAACAMAVLPY